MAERKRVRYPGSSVWVELKNENTSPNTPAKGSEGLKADGKSSRRGPSEPPDSPIGDLELSATGMATPPPLLYSRKPVLRRKTRAPLATATTEELSRVLDNMILRLDEGRNMQQGSPTCPSSAGETSSTQPNMPAKGSEFWKTDGQRSRRGQSQPPLATATTEELSRALDNIILRLEEGSNMQQASASSLPSAVETSSSKGASQHSEDLHCDREKNFNQSEQGGAGCDLGGGVSKMCSNKHTEPLPRKVLQPRRKDLMEEGVGDFKSFIEGATNTSTPGSARPPKPHVGDRASSDGTEL